MTQLLTLPDGRRLAFDEHGDLAGAPVFLFHGTPGSRLFRHPDAAIARDQRARIITVDRPGYGRSDFQPGRRLLDWPDDVAFLADALGIARFAVAGMSGGSPYAAACAFKFPHRVTAAALVSGSGPFDVPGITVDLQRTTRFFFDLAARSPWLMTALLTPLARADAEDPAGALRQLASVFAPSDLELFREPEVLAELLADSREAFRAGARGAAWDMALVARPWGFRPEWLEVPVYLWHGDLDRNVPVATGRYLAAAIPGCRATFCPEEGHMLFFRHWREILTGLTAPA